MTMKHIICIMFLLSMPVIGSAHTPDSLSKATDELKIEIKVSEVSDALAKAVCYVTSEIIQFKKETEENISPETREAVKTIKETIRKELKYARDAVHAGYVQGLRGENYSPPYEH